MGIQVQSQIRSDTPSRFPTDSGHNILQDPTTATQDLRGGGQGRRGDGHTCRSALATKGAAISARKALGTVVFLFLSLEE